MGIIEDYSFSQTPDSSRSSSSTGYVYGLLCGPHHQTGVYNMGETPCGRVAPRLDHIYRSLMAGSARLIIIIPPWGMMGCVPAVKADSGRQQQSYHPSSWILGSLGSFHLVPPTRWLYIGAATSRRADRTHYARRVGPSLGSLIIITTTHLNSGLPTACHLVKSLHSVLSPSQARVR